MKKLLAIAIWAISVSANAQTASVGQIFDGAGKGKKIKLGSDKAVNAVLSNIKAYNLNDGSDLPQYVDDKAPNGLKSMITDWHKGMKMLNEVPHGIFSVKVDGEKNEHVFVYADEDRIYKNGSTQKLKVMEVFEVTPEGKVANFSQFSQIPETNEFGKTTGGKLYVTNMKGSSFQFSNRGEIEKMEKFMDAYNKMDSKTCQELLADKVIIHDFDGVVSTMTKDMIPAIFAEYSSLDWKPISMLPFKITDTDPAAGLLVNAREKRVLKDGTVWEKELIEFFEFNVDGKISGITQYSRGIDKK
jgi:hypothetical protein